jgi:hypothetical protein
MFYAKITGSDDIISARTLDALKEDILDTDSDFGNAEYFKQNVFIIKGEEYLYSITETQWELR